MDAFVPDFEHDVFVSYTHADNRTFRGDVGCIDTFVNDLREALRQKLKRNQAAIWQDPRLEGSTPFPDTIGEAVTHAATLLVFLSESYLTSEWCEKERELFLQAAGQTGGSTGRLFVVRLDALDHTSWPDAFSDLLGFQFFEQANPDAPARTLGTPLADDPRDRLYFQRLDDLSSELADRLHEMKSAQETSAQAPDSPDASDSLSAENSPTVFLAEATPDLDELRDDLRRHLKQLNIRVLPERHYDRTPDAFRTAMESDLEQSLLFVQLLGPYVTRHTDDLPKGYEGLQLDIAEEKEMPILRWHSQELDVTSVRDPELLKRAEVIAAPFGEFKAEVTKKTHLLESQRTPSIIEGNGAYVLLNANSRDEQIVQTISQALEQQGIGYDTADENEDIAVLTEEDDFQGLLIVYGECAQKWAKQQVRTCRQLLLKKKQRAPLCAVYLGPPDEKLPLGIKPPKVSFFTYHDQTALTDFFVSVRAKVAEP